MSPRVIFADHEATGIDPYTDRIIEFAYQESGRPAFVARVNPGVPIPPDSTAVHGITDADVADCLAFAYYAPEIQALVTDAVLCGYSCRRYDTILLHTELVRAEQPGLITDSVGRIIHPEIDLYELWFRHESRKLVTAAKRFAGVELGEAAHGALADSTVLPAVLDGMCAQFGLNASDIDALCRLSIPEGAIDRDGKFLKREDGVIIFNFGKSKGQPAEDDIGLLEWVMRQPFMTSETRAVAHALYQRALKRWQSA